MAAVAVSHVTLFHARVLTKASAYRPHILLLLEHRWSAEVAGGARGASMIGYVMHRASALPYAELKRDGH